MDIPGAYPATPAAAAGDSQQHKQLAASNEPQGQHQARSNLQDNMPQHQEQHGHSHADSGVGLTGADSKESQQHLSPLAKLGNLVQHGSMNPQPPKATAEHHEATPQHQEATPQHHEQHGHSHADSGVALTGADPNPHSKDNQQHQSPLAKLGNIAHHGSTNPQPPKNTAVDHGSTEAPPYWGDLPRASGGGIYNTVTGHGSPTDDHDQHHHLPPHPRSADETPADSSIDRAATSLPTGGVYNTVTGHGSQEAGQHRQQDSSRDAPRQDSSNRGVLLGGGAAAAAAGHGQHSESHAARGTSQVEPQRGIASNTAPDANYGAVRGDHQQSQPGHAAAGGALGALGGRQAQQHFDHSHAANPNVSSNPAVASKPLPPAPVGDDSDNQRSIAGHATGADNTNNQRSNAGLATGAGLAGGVAASELAHRHAREQQPAATHTDDRRRDEHHTREPPAAAVASHAHKEERHTAEKHRHEEPKTRHSSDKHEHDDDKSHRKSGILGIFHRHKDDKDDKPSERAKLTKEPPSPRAAEVVREPAHHEKEQKHRADSPKQESGGLGLFHHHKEEKTADKHHADDNQHARHAPPAAEKTVLPAAVASKTHGHTQSRETEHTQAAPASAVAHSSQIHGHEQPQASEKSRTGPTLAAAGAGAGAGLAASSVARRHEESQNPQEASGAGQGPPPRQFDLSPSHQHAAGQSAGTHGAPGTSNTGVQYNVLPSGTPSGVKVQSRDTTLRDNDPSHTTASGTNVGHHDSNRQGAESTSNRHAGAAAGAGTAVAAAAAAASLSRSNDNNDRTIDPRSATEQHDTHPSGTSSGIKTHSQEPSREHTTGTGALAHRQATHETQTTSHDDGKYNSLHSGTPSGINVGHNEPAHSQADSSRSATQQQHNQPRDAALAASTTAWSSSAPAPTSKPVLHECDNCGKQNDISRYFTKDSLAKIVGQ